MTRRTATPRAMPDPAPAWTARFLAYCRAHGTPDPRAMLSRDAARYPGGRMAGFMLWIGARWCDFYRAEPKTHGRRDLDRDQAAFDAWLAAWMDAHHPAPPAG